MWEKIIKIQTKKVFGNSGNNVEKTLQNLVKHCKIVQKLHQTK